MHPHRHALHNELHARPPLYFEAPAQVFHLAFLDRDGAMDAILGELCASRAGGPDPALPQGELATSAGRLAWERHTEFLTLTLACPGVDDTLWPALPPLLAGIATAHAELLVNADLLRIETAGDPRDPLADYGFDDPVGSSLHGGRATLWSDLRLNAAGLNCVLLRNDGLDGRRLGRTVRLLLDIETYRLMASLTLPLARSLAPELRRYERELTELSDANAAARPGGDARSLLARITQLSADIMQAIARSRLRFSATEAYAELVFERIAQLEESRVGDCQQLGTFIERRFRPTVRYCASTDRRMARIASAVADLTRLLQARVQVDMEEQNGRILRSLSERAATQIRIQRAVEGLSVIAISYYLIGLFRYLYDGTRVLGFAPDARTALLAAAPLAALILVLIAWRIHHSRHDD